MITSRAAPLKRLSLMEKRSSGIPRAEAVAILGVKRSTESDSSLESTEVRSENARHVITTSSS